MKELLLALALAHATDAGTTAHNLVDGLAELNPLQPKHVAANLALHAGVAAAQLQAFRVLERRQPRAARVLAIVALSAEAMAIGNNLRAHADAGRR